jgi:tRNA-splicing ligase RtcB
MSDIHPRNIDDNIWEIPREEGMNVPVRIFASEQLLEHIKDDKTLQQAKNMTHLPGIQKYAIVLPDGHQGYGFPVGGVAALSTQNGGISPGAIGYDINCLTSDTDVLLEFGRRKKIAELKDDFADERAIVSAEQEEQSLIQLFTQKEEQPVYRIETETGETLKATEDHPLLTPDGMTPVSDIGAGTEIYVKPFRGVEEEEPEEFTILDREDFKEADPQLVRALEDRNILPLKSTDRRFNILLKLVGFHTGDGSFNNHGNSDFYADREDLERIQEDIRAVGFTPSPIYSRQRDHQVKDRAFERTEHVVRSTSKAFQQLLIKLGAPEGRKVESDFTLPDYFDRLTKWQKALYLSAFFGAEMSSPKAQHDKNLYCPKISQNRTKNHRDAGKEFMQQIKQALAELDVQTNQIEEFETVLNSKNSVDSTELEEFGSDSNQEHEMLRFRLGVKNDSKNIIQFFTTIGYRYNLTKQKKAIKATQYLKTKQQAIKQREKVAQQAVKLYESGAAPKKIKQQFDINNRFIERSIWGGRTTSARPPSDFPSYDEYAEDIKVKDNLTTTNTVRSIEKAGTETVYDIGVEHDAHNFAANQFIVSNCGVRMIRTDIPAEEIYDRAEQLANILFQKVPSGLGKGCIADLETTSDVDDVLKRGMKWALDNGYAVEDDLEHCEDNGYRSEADPSTVSQKAKGRGKHQLGSLGSGNHFLEIQKVSEIYDEETAEKFGLKHDHAVILIHCGSRGFGHQVCSDYLRKIEKQFPELLDELPDRELAYAPAGSQLADEYYKAMCAAINFAWTNRQLITYQIRQCFERIFNESWQELGMDVLYDVAHNIGKKETHTIDGEEQEVYVHRKGSTRAFPAGRPELPDAYSDIGQPVLIPGSMGTSSYVLKGGSKSLDISFGSTAHGAGRLMSRTQAKKDYKSNDIQKDLKRQKIIVKAQSGNTIEEEAPEVYKDVDQVVQVSDQLGIGEKVARTFPIVNIKG